MYEPSWVVLEISSRGEEEAKAGVLKKLIVNISNFVESDIYIPIITQGGESLWLMEGYIFIKSGYGVSEYYDLKNSPYINSIVSEIDEKTGLISKGVIKESQLKALIKKADDLGGSFQAGDSVKIKKGDFEGFSAEVMSDWKTSDNIRMYTLLITLRSVEIILTIDSISLEGE